MKNATTSLPVIEMKALAGNDVPHLNAMQEFLAPHVQLLASSWWFVLFVTLVLVTRYVWKHGDRHASP